MFTRIYSVIRFTIEFCAQALHGKCKLMSRDYHVTTRLEVLIGRHFYSHTDFWLNARNITHVTSSLSSECACFRLKEKEMNDDACCSAASFLMSVLKQYKSFKNWRSFVSFDVTSYKLCIRTSCSWSDEPYAIQLSQWTSGFFFQSSSVLAWF